ncbi:MAG: DUF2079 domain-containing protein [Chloroflexota bacterium]
MIGPRDRWLRAVQWPLVALWVLVALYVLNFTWLSIRQNQAFQTNAHDLGVMDQAAWNTRHGRFGYETSNGVERSRLAGHVEPVFLLLAIPYLLYNGAEALLILQTLVIALGALPVFWLAKAKLGSSWAGVAFGAMYLLFPALEAANLTEFHPVALTAAFFLFAFHYLQDRNRLGYALALVLALASKEDMALVGVMFGLYALVVQRDRVLGLVTTAASLAWFAIALYLVIPSFSPSGGFVLFQRYAEVGGTPLGVVRSFLLQPGLVLNVVARPEKMDYLLGLLASAGFAPLLAPEVLALAAPSLGINLLSNYPAMYSGVSHYSAPIVPFLVVASIYGTSRARQIAGICLPAKAGSRVFTGAATTVLVLSVGLTHYHLGFTPLGRRFAIPKVTPHHRLLERFVRQIPAEAVVSTQPPLYPHLSGRRFIYLVPDLNDAEYVLLDVTSRVDMHPNDFYAFFQDRLLARGYGVVDAADGYILLRRGSWDRLLPDGFYSFVRPESGPSHPVEIDFGGKLRFLGYDLFEVHEDGRWMTSLQLYWRACCSGVQLLNRDFRLYPYFFDENGRVIEDTSLRPMVNLIWYPTSRWKTGEVVTMRTWPWPVGDRFSVGLGVTEGDWSRLEQRLPATLVSSSAPVRPLDRFTAVELARLERRDGKLVPIKMPLAMPGKAWQASFADRIRLLGFDLPKATYSPGERVAVRLHWEALGKMEADYSVFVHLVDEQGRIRGQKDLLLGGEDYPTSWWVAGQAMGQTVELVIDEKAPPGQYRLLTGLYRLQTLQRLTVIAGASGIQVDSVDLGAIQVASSK